MRISELVDGPIVEALPPWFTRGIYHHDDREERRGMHGKFRTIRKPYRDRDGDEEIDDAGDLDITTDQSDQTDSSQQASDPDDPYDDGIRAPDMHIIDPMVGRVLASGHFRDRIRQKITPKFGWSEDLFLDMVIKRMRANLTNMREVPRDVRFAISNPDGWLAVLINRGKVDKPTWRLITTWPDYRTEKIDTATGKPMRVMREEAHSSES